MNKGRLQASVAKRCYDYVQKMMKEENRTESNAVETIIIQHEEMRKRGLI